ncbi:MAG: LysR substrate-binding domain-containing protein [Pseudomonadota bacterium]
MNLIKALESYQAVVEQNGFAAAARQLGVSRALVNKQVQQLERHLGTQLLKRSTRVVTPTETGLAFYDRTRFLLAELDNTIADISSMQGAVRGNLRVNVPMSFGIMYMGKMISGFMEDYPDVHVELSLTDRFVDLIEEGFDVTLRIATLEHMTSVVSEPLGQTDLVLCASPRYLEQHPLRQPENLKSARCLHYGFQQTGQRWVLNGPEGEVSTRVNCVMWSNNGQVLKDVAINHQGVVLLPTFLVGGELQSGQLARVLPDYSASPLDIVAMYPRHRYLSDKVRVFVDYLKRQFGPRPIWSLVD